MDLVVEKTQGVSGKIEPSPSKFYTQFATVAAFLSEGKSVIKSPLRVGDTRVLARAIKDMGATVKRTEKKWTIWGLEGSQNPSGHVFDAKNSPMCLSLMTSLATFSPYIMIVTADEQLRQTPAPSLIKALSQLGVEIHSTKQDYAPPLVIFESNLKGGKIDFGRDMDPFYLPAALLLMPYAEKKVELVLTPNLKGRFLDASVELMEKGKTEVSVTQRRLRVPSGGFKPLRVTPPLDMFSTIPYVTAAILTDSKLRISKISHAENVSEFVEVLEKMGVELDQTSRSIKISSTQELNPRKIDLEGYSELLPFFAVMSTTASGTTRFVNASKARMTKSDRIKATVEGLKKMGVKVTEQEDGLTIEGPTTLKGSTVDGHNDDVIVAALGVAGLNAEDTTIIRNKAEALRGSYPKFVTEFQDLGADMGYESQF